MCHSQICSKIQVFVSIFAARMVLSAQQLFAIGKKQPLAWAARRSRPRWACRSRKRSGGCRGSAQRARCCRTALGDHVAAEAGVCVVFSLHLSFRTSLELRVSCAFCSVGSDDKNRDRNRRVFVPASLINAWVAAVPCCLVASVRKRLQASGIERGRRPQAEHWLGKQVICVEILVFLCHSYLFGPPSGEASALDGAEQAAAPGEVHIDVAAPWRSEAAAFGVLLVCSRSTEMADRIVPLKDTAQNTPFNTSFDTPRHATNTDNTTDTDNTSRPKMGPL